jgi:hypothetical protein
MKTISGETVAAMGTIAFLIWEAAQTNDIDAGLPQGFWSDDGHLHHFWLDVPVREQIFHVMIVRPDPVGRSA